MQALRWENCTKKKWWICTTIPGSSSGSGSRLSFMILIFALLIILPNDISYFSNSSNKAIRVWCRSTSQRFLGGGGLGFLPRFLSGGGGSSNFSQSFFRVSISHTASSKPSAIVSFGSSGSSCSDGGGVGGGGVSGSGDGVLLLNYNKWK